MLFLHKLLPIFALPLGFVFLLLTLALWRRKRWPAVVAAAAFYIPKVGYTHLTTTPTNLSLRPWPAPQSSRTPTSNS